MIEAILSLVFLIAAGFLGKKWMAAKRVLKEVSEALVKISEAVADDKITRKELKEITKELEDVVRAVKQLKA